MTALDEAVKHQTRRTRTTDSTTAAALRLWHRIDPQQLDAGWAFVGPTMVEVVQRAQLVAAQQANAFVNQVPADVEAASIVPEAFVGITLDGRELAPAMYGAVTTTKQLTTTYGATRAFEVGASFLATVIGSAIQDMGRAADGTLSAGRKFTQYVRVLSPGACSRCGILAGKSSTPVPFKRHPRCKCTAYPLANGRGPVPDGMYGSPDDYFDSLGRDEQDRIFTKAGAEAIRKGADPIKVVNARRGAYGIGYGTGYATPVTMSRLQPLTIGVKADGSPLQVYATTEGTTRRGQFGKQNFTGEGRRTTTVRLMPEQILKMAGDDPDRWVTLLRKYGYLT